MYSIFLRVERFLNLDRGCLLETLVLKPLQWRDGAARVTVVPAALLSCKAETWELQGIQVLNCAYSEY